MSWTTGMAGTHYQPTTDKAQYMYRDAIESDTAEKANIPDNQFNQQNYGEK
jgi:hypothetical protein